MTDYSVQIQNIKKRLRLAMNGVVSSSMRDRGLDYSLNFGVALPTLRKMGKELGKDPKLAQSLWKQDIRELRILATMVQTIESFTREQANVWVNSIVTPELAEQISMNLLQYLDFAKELVFDWLKSEKELIRYTAWHLLARITSRTEVISDAGFQFLLKEALADLISGKLYLFNGALLGLKRIGLTDKNYAEIILSEIRQIKLTECENKDRIYDDLKFEFDYYQQTLL